jgi:alkylresorcinol/alkylpyrone synthase
MPTLEALAVALPDHELPQARAREAVETLLGRPVPLFDRAGVRTRRFCFPLEYYLRPRPFEERNADFARGALDLAERAARDCLRRAGARAADVDHLLLVTTTGLATPSLDALLAGRLGLRADVRRWPLFGLGCAGGVGALVRAGELPGLALAVAVELSGQVFSVEALEPVDLVGAALFGDGAAAALVSPRGDGPRLAAGRSELFADTDRLMGWRFTGGGMRLVLSPEVAGLVRDRLPGVVDRFLDGAGLSRRDVTDWALHPGGRRILEAYEAGLGLDAAALRWSRGSLERVGNVSSASALFALADLIAAGPRPGRRVLLAGLGPGFAAELAVLEG